MHLASESYKELGSGRGDGETRHYDFGKLRGNFKATHNKRQQSVRKVVAKGGVGIPEVKAALAFIKLLGSVKAATEALAVAQEIRETV